MRYRQQLSVPYAYDVVFTRDLFRADNESLSEVLAQSEGPARMAVFMSSWMRSFRLMVGGLASDEARCGCPRGLRGGSGERIGCQ